MLVDLRSDTVTKPGKAMLEAMISAEVGDDVFREDPTVNLLEKRVAALFGMECALWCVSGTMSNQVAITTHTHPGDELICDHESHVFYYEGGGIAFNAGCQARTIVGDRGKITAEQVRKLINPDDVHRPKTALVCLENTTNRGGGSCYELENIRRIRAVCDEADLKLHLDGARLFNALVARSESPLEYGQLFHSISLCFNKGLGCPAGSMLIGTEKFIREAIRKRKVFGGGLRQAGFMAATALFALDHQVDRLATDHLNAKKIETALVNHPWINMVLPVETNLIIFELKENFHPGDFIRQMKDKGVLLLSISEKRLRIVTHLGISQEMLEYFLKTLSGIH